jgi:hypothetical protein
MVVVAMTPDQITSSTPQQEREVLEALFHERFPEPEMVGAPLSDERLAWHAAFKPWAVVRERFRAMLDCGAYESAVLMLLPKGWIYRLETADAFTAHAVGGAYVSLWNDQGDCVAGDDCGGKECHAATAAIALAAAITKADEA